MKILELFKLLEHYNNIKTMQKKCYKIKKYYNKIQKTLIYSSNRFSKKKIKKWSNNLYKTFFKKNFQKTFKKQNVIFQLF